MRYNGHTKKGEKSDEVHGDSTNVGEGYACWIFTFVLLMTENASEIHGYYGGI